MPTNSFKDHKIPLKELIMWDENARFPDKYFNTDEMELINYFLSKPDFKIKDLIDEVVKDFDLPHLEKLVIWKNIDTGQLIALEGNRRLAAYKLLNTPSLTSDLSLVRYLEEQKKIINITDNFLLDCLVSEIKEEGYRYLDRKHAKGNNEVNWQDAERAQYSVRRGSKNQIELLKIGITHIIKELDLPEEMKDQILGKGYVTTFFRIITSKAAKTEYGFEFDSENNLIVKDPDFQEKLKVIIFNVLQKHDSAGKPVDSRSLNTKDETSDYIKSIKTEDAKKVEEEIKKNTTEDLFGEKNITVTTGKKSKVIPKSTNRKYLIPNNCILVIKEKKLNNIYNELCNDLLLDDSLKAVPNAVGVLFRVFLEGTVDCFLEKEGINPSDKIKLSGKITKCAEILEKKKIATPNQLVNIRKVATDQHSLLGIQNFHDYVHSYRTQPSPNDLKQKWDNLEEFFQIVWAYHFKKASKKK